MPADSSSNLSRLAVHTVTVKESSLANTASLLAAAGVPAVCPWTEHVEAVGVETARRIIDDAGLTVPSYVRGGFFVHPEAIERTNAIDRTRALLDDAAVLNADMLVIVPGAHPAVPLEHAREIVTDALCQLTDHATGVNVALALEPLHPMYAVDRSCVNTLTQARAVCDQVNHASVGVAVDVYHAWWDDRLEHEIGLLSKGNRLLAFHICDFLPNTNSLLTDRGLMGEGCIPIASIRRTMQAAGFDGYDEVEILSQRHWDRDPRDVVADTVRAYKALG